jgi:hypothetical protein
MTYRIKGWVKFQHFKDRRPPWIKLYRDILEDPDWHDLDGDTAKILVALWLLASEDDDQQGRLPDARRLAFRLRISETKVNQALTKLSHWLEHDGINTISSGYQDDAPETETETETETKKEKREIQKALPCPDSVNPATWADFLQVRKAKKAPVTAAAISGIEREARKAGWSLEKALLECCARGWAGFKADWVADKGPQKTQHQLNNEAMARSIGLIPKHDEYQGNIIEGEIYESEPTTTKRLG